MGFDMQFVQSATTLPEWYEPIWEKDPGYYQLTFGGMFEVGAAMAAAGLLDEAMTVPTLPEWPPPGLTSERAEELKPRLFDAAELDQVINSKERSIIAAFLTCFSDATGQQSKLRGRVPAYKFCSNDGWLVTPDECRVIADGLDVALAGRRDELLRGLQDRGYSRTSETVVDLLLWWLQYNRVAADHGGYRVR